MDSARGHQDQLTAPGCRGSRFYLRHNGEMPDYARALHESFVHFSRKQLKDEYWPKIRRCLDSLTDEQIWWRPNDESNSIGNLLLHLNGNVRQWIVASLGGISNVRDRDAEFAERNGKERAAMVSALEETLAEFDRILAAADTDDLLKTYTIQRYENVTGLEAIYHVVEHFSMHCGQILYITKLLSGSDLGFYKQLSGWGQVP
jgi:uncharacterized damage-inducible protein DinB